MLLHKCSFVPLLRKKSWLQGQYVSVERALCCCSTEKERRDVGMLGKYPRSEITTTTTTMYCPGLETVLPPFTRAQMPPTV